MQTEQAQNFNERLSQWVANQGIWFQIRYSVLGSGVKGRAMFHLFRLGARLLVLLLLLIVGVGVFLVKRPGTNAFRTSIRQELTEGLSATRLEMRGLNHMQGQLDISRVAAEGGNGTFFTNLEAKNIRCKMGYLDGLVGTWTPGIISIVRLNVDLRAGSEDALSSQKFADALFRSFKGIQVSSFEVGNANFHWGYSDRTMGSIEGSILKMQRIDSGWRMSFKGGVFRQNWLNNLEIESLVVECDADGLVFETADFKQGAGTVNLAGLRIIGGESPQVRGVAKIRNIPLEQALPSAMQGFVDGSLSGDFEVSGSTNSSEGVCFDGQVVMDGQSVISLRDRIHLLKALAVMDYTRNYHRIDFRDGSFRMKTRAGGLEVSEVKLKAKDIMTLEGELKVRPPTQEEVNLALEKKSTAGGSPLFTGDDESNRLLTAEKSDFSLMRAALEAKRIRDGLTESDELSLFDKLGVELELRRLQDQAAERLSRMLQYKGSFAISISGDAFDREPELRRVYPPDPGSKRIPLQVPVEGNLYDLTLNQAEEIYHLGRR